MPENGHLRHRLCPAGQRQPPPMPRQSGKTRQTRNDKKTAFIKAYRSGFNEILRKYGKPDLVHVHVMTRQRRGGQDHPATSPYSLRDHRTLVALFQARFQKFPPPLAHPQDLVKPGDEDALCHALNRMSDNFGNYDPEEILHGAQRFSFAEVGMQLSRIYAEAVDQHIVFSGSGKTGRCDHTPP